MHHELKALSIGALFAVIAAPALADKTLRYLPEAGSTAEPMTILVQAPSVRLETSDFAFLYDVAANQTMVMHLT